MFSSLRRAAKGWVAWVIVIGLSIPFALFGIDQFGFGHHGDRVIATLGDHEITVEDYILELRNQQQLLQQRFGEQYNQIDQQLVRRQVLSQVVGRGALFAQAKDMGFAVDGAVIKEVVLRNPQFQTDDQFDANKYRQFLQLNGFSPKYYESQLVEEILMNQFFDSYINSDFVTNSDLETFYQMSNHERQFAYVLLPWQNAQQQVEVSQEEISAAYEEQKESFRTALQLKVNYLSISLDEEQEIDYTEQDIQDHFDNLIGRYSSPERRQVRHILFDADNQELAENVLQQIINGADFASLAEQYSEDNASAENGGDLGEITSGLMVGAFDDASFSVAQTGLIEELVESEFGYHIIDVTSITPAKAAAFDEVRDEIVESYLNEKRMSGFFAKQQQLAELVFEQPEDIEAVAETMGIDMQTSDWFSSEEGSSGTITANADFRQLAFQQNAQQAEEMSSIIEISDQQIAVLKIAETKPSVIQPMEEVSDQISQTLTQQKALTVTQQQQESNLRALNQGSLQWQNYVASVDFDATLSKPDLVWVGIQSVGEDESLAAINLMGEVFEETRIRASKHPRGVFSIRTTVDGDLLVIYQKDSRDIEVVLEDMLDSDSALAMRRFYEQNSNTQITEIIRQRYPTPNIDLEEVIPSLAFSHY